MMKSQRGFTLIELILFIIVSGILARTILLSLIYPLINSPSVHNQVIANQLAAQCMEWFLGQKRMLGYSSLSCPSTPSASMCSTISGFTVSANIACTTISSDASYKTITVTVSGLGHATLNTLIGEF